MIITCLFIELDVGEDGMNAPRFAEHAAKKKKKRGLEINQSGKVERRTVKHNQTDSKKEVISP